MELVCFYIGMSLWLGIPGGPFVNMDHATMIKPAEGGTMVCSKQGGCHVLGAVTIDDIKNCGKGKAA